jgi:hypothetical protein
MKLKTMTMAWVLTLVPLAASAWELQEATISQIEFHGTLQCAQARGALRCSLVDQHKKTVAETTTAAPQGWVDVKGMGDARLSAVAKGGDLVVTLKHPRIRKDLVLRFAGLAARAGAGKAQSRTQSTELQLTQPMTYTQPPPPPPPAPQGRPGGLAAKPRPQHGERDEDGPIGPGTLALVGGTTNVGVTQLGAGGAAQATVPMEHDACGIDCDTHSLATTKGNLKVPIEITVGCPAGQHVSHVSYQVEGQFVTQLVGAPQASAAYKKTVHIVPNSLSDLEETCRAELGGSWPSNNPHPAVQKQEKALLLKEVTAWGQCTGDGAKTAKQLTTKTQLTCVDTDYPVAPTP